MIQQLGKYYQWADQKIIELLESVIEKQFTEKIEGSGRSLRDLSEHLIESYEYLIGRDKGVSMEKIKKKIGKMTQNELLSHWKQVLSDFITFTDKLNIESVEIPVEGGDPITLSPTEYLFCFTDHATYHRGQIVYIYKFLTKNPAVTTDYFDFIAGLS